uniref:Uncharacterized protein n=1 Tax=Anguilla anguilla TaxID=7936 RepID=A0A0E9X8N7_ANGAN
MGIKTNMTLLSNAYTLNIKKHLFPFVNLKSMNVLTRCSNNRQILHYSTITSGGKLQTKMDRHVKYTHIYTMCG